MTEKLGCNCCRCVGGWDWFPYSLGQKLLWRGAGSSWGYPSGVAGCWLLCKDASLNLGCLLDMVGWELLWRSACWIKNVKWSGSPGEHLEGRASSPSKVDRECQNWLQPASEGGQEKWHLPTLPFLEKVPVDPCPPGTCPKISQ